MARSMARRIRSGTLVGPGTNRKLRPGIDTRPREKEKQSENRWFSLKLLGLTYSATLTPQPHGWVGLAPPKVRGVNRLATHVTARTPGRALSEILEQGAAPASVALHVAPHFRRVLPPVEVGAPPQHHALRGAAIAARPTRFLIVGLDCARWAPVQHATHIGLVDAHAERARGNNDPRAVGEKRA